MKSIHSRVGELTYYSRWNSCELHVTIK